MRGVTEVQQQIDAETARSEQLKELETYTKTKKYEKIATVKGEKKISYKNKKLKKGSTYSYKVRAYMTVEDTDYFGGYSAVAKIKVK